MQAGEEITRNTHTGSLRSLYPECAARESEGVVLDHDFYRCPQLT